MKFTWDQVRTWRLARHHLLERAPSRSLQAVVGDVVGIHAQVMSSAELQLAARVQGLTPAKVAEALWKRRSLVKTWSIRGTLHLLPARDFPLLAAALRTRQQWRKPYWQRGFGVTLREMEGIMDGVPRALGAKGLTREELADAVAKQGRPYLRERLLSGWGELLKPVAFEGELCFGPNRGRNVTFVRPRDWLGRWEEHDPEEALREVVRRYLRANGPATVDDVAGWWGTPPATVRRAVKALGGDLEEIDVEGFTGWFPAADADALAATELAPSVLLLPGFDVYVMGFRQREHLVAEPFRARVFRKAGWVSPVLLVDGNVAGVWDAGLERDRLRVAVDPFVKLSKAERSRIEAAVSDRAVYLGKRAEVAWSGP